MVGKAGPGGCYARWAPALSVMGSAQLSRLHDVNVGMAGSDGRFVRSVPALSVTGTTVTGIGGAAIANRRLLRVEDSAPSSSEAPSQRRKLWDSLFARTSQAPEPMHGLPGRHNGLCN